MKMGKIKNRKWRDFNYRKLWVLMPIVFVSYVVWVNLAPLGSVEEFVIDFGADDTVGKARLTGPFDRVSEPSIMDGITYRNLTSNLVYFVLEYPFFYRVSEIEVSIRFKDTLLENEAIYIGAKNGEGWSYDWNIAYGRFLENKTIYKEIPYEIPKGSLVATDLNLKSKENVLDEVPNKTLVINTFLRDSHTAYVYVKDKLNLTVTKRDLNWYEGKDVLKISIFKGEKLINSTIVPDDGIENKSKKLGKEQIASIYLPNLEEGVYKIVFESNADLFMERMEVYPAKFVLDGKVFSIGTNSSLYFGESSETKLYFSVPRKRILRFLTYHKCAFQNLTLSTKRIEINDIHTWFEMELEDGFYELVMPKSDVIVEGNVYFSFTRNSYFDPFEYRTVGIDYRGVEEADYIVSNVEFERYGDWIIAKTRWDLRDLYVRNDELSFVIRAPFLKGNKTLPVDWVKIRVITNPLV